MGYLRSRCNLFSLGTGSTPAKWEITLCSFEKYQTKSLCYVKNELKGQKQKINK